MATEFSIWKIKKFKARKKDVLFSDALNMLFILRLHGIELMAKEHSESERFPLDILVVICHIIITKICCVVK